MSSGVVVAGHVCLDVIPEITSEMHDFPAGALLAVGPALTATGGCVANTGAALARLGVPTTLVAKIGADMFGERLRRVLAEEAPGAHQRFRIAEGEVTSYSVVLSAPGRDRTFLHCAGANHSFVQDDVSEETLESSSWLHFGYPPLMNRIYSDPKELAQLFRRAHAAGAVTSLDMAQPDPKSEANAVDWRGWFANVLPETDVFCPSCDELHVMLHGCALKGAPDPEWLEEAASVLLGWGARVILIKLGEFGVYLRSASELGWLNKLVPAPSWAARQLYAPCFHVDVVGTTGAGDSTIAGFIAAMLNGQTAEQAVQLATAVGACSVEAHAAASGVVHQSAVEQRISAGWSRLPPLPAMQPWRRNADTYLGPNDPSNHYSKESEGANHAQTQRS